MEVKSGEARGVLSIKSSGRDLRNTFWKRLEKDFETVLNLSKKSGCCPGLWQRSGRNSRFQAYSPIIQTLLDANTDRLLPDSIIDRRVA